ncbi:OB-fold-containig protein [Paraburkholderia graminis]|uniref:Inner membrane protein YqiJ OB-fold domain-containing protein n=1 Tax=Paraburkholderia graminis TaxID=60548 RepID=A0ABD5CB69_9BURK|nr:OB-fold-containig protein [Paraburkholderia graminis]MDR6202511.1 hypothetical protein [Paraburkholderia graminis]
MDAATGNPAEARLEDKHGRTYQIRIEPARAGQVLARGTTIAIVSRVSESLYGAASAGKKSSRALIEKRSQETTKKRKSGAA